MCGDTHITVTPVLPTNFPYDEVSSETDWIVRFLFAHLN